MRRLSQNNKGFSLLECLIAMVVFSVAILGLAGLQVGLIKANDSAKRRTVATNAAQTQIDRLRRGQACNPYLVPQGYSMSCVSATGPNSTTDWSVTVSWPGPYTQTVQLQIRI